MFLKIIRSHFFKAASFLLCVQLLFIACGTVQTIEENEKITGETTAQEVYENTEESTNGVTNQESSEEKEEPEENQEIRDEIDFSVLKYAGNPSVIVNENKPFFDENERTVDEAFESYSQLDNLGRCGAAYANVCIETMPTEPRGEIGSVKPTGWVQKKYEGIVDSEPPYLYNRCHLIGFQLSGENANEKNLITGTRYLNIDGMLPYENMVADYVEETKNHVLYRVTPYFDGENLLANGVLMEAYSVEDQGVGLCFCVYCFNVQPGVNINYSTGESSAEENYTPVEEVSLEDADYVINKNTRKFHNPDCSSVQDMKEKNKDYYKGSREELIEQGYEPCGRCNP